MAWHVIQCRARDHTGVVAFCVSYNNGGEEIRPQARGADGLVRMCLGPGGNVCCLSGRCPATGRRPPMPAEPIERRGSAVKRRAELFTGQAGRGGNKGQGAEAGIAWDQGKASSIQEGALEASSSERLNWWPALASAWAT